MVAWRSLSWVALGSVVNPLGAVAAQQETGSIRGVVYDRDFEVPLAAATVTVIGGQEVQTSDQGNYLINDVPAGTYTLVFSKQGYARQVKAEVLVSAGRLAEVDASLAGDFTDMEEFVVQDLLLIGGGSEAALLELRLESPAFVDSIGADLMNRAGASDAAGALRLVTGASLQDGKSAVIRGLPDRFVSTQLNGVRLPTADEDKRAVELDQFPSAAIESLQVSKTFTPDQQGDASGGAVNIRLKGVPEQSTFDIKLGLSQNSQVEDAGDDFLTYEGGGVDTWGRRAEDIEPQLDRLGQNWDGALGTSREAAPQQYNWAVAGGHREDIGRGWTVGGYASFFYKRDSSYFDDGVNDSYWVTPGGGGMVPRTVTGTPGEGGDFKTQLFDIEQGSQSVQWGGLGAVGIENENHSITLSYLYTRTAEDTATIAQDTRGKSYFFPGYDPTDPTAEGNRSQNRQTAPWIRNTTLEYTERTTSSLILNGTHRLPLGDLSLGDGLVFKAPELDWQLASSKATLDQPDKRLFSAIWLPPTIVPGQLGLPPTKIGGTWLPFKPDASAELGNVQRIFKTVDESTDQYAVNLKLPFEQWSQDQGYLKFGVFDDDLERTFTQETFSNFGQGATGFDGPWEPGWAEEVPTQGQPVGTTQSVIPITESTLDIDYEGRQRISAWYSMIDLPIVSDLHVIGGARWESTDLSIVNTAEEDATWFPPGSGGAVDLEPGDADVDFSQDDVLPSIGVVYEPVERFLVRASYSETVARQTFKELTPIIQQEFVGGPIFIGNPELEMAALENYDLRFDYTPSQGSLISVSWFRKNVTNPIEYVQRPVGFDYTTPLNFPTGKLSGWELEARQQMGRFAGALEGLALGANATFIDSEVTLDPEEASTLPSATDTRPMTNAPEYIYNLFATYDIEPTQTQVALFYTVQGDTLIAGAGTSDAAFVPDVFQTEFGSLNFSLRQRLGRFFVLQFQAKNLTNPAIQTVYRSDLIEDDVLRTSFTRGIDLSLSIGASFSF